MTGTTVYVYMKDEAGNVNQIPDQYHSVTEVDLKTNGDLFLRCARESDAHIPAENIDRIYIP